MEEELKKLNWFLKGFTFTMVPDPTQEIKSGEDLVKFINENNLAIVNFNVVSNIRKELVSKQKEWEMERELDKEEMEQMKKAWEEERDTMKREMRKLQVRKELFKENTTKIVETIRKIGQLTGFKESFGSEDSKVILVGQHKLDRFYDHVESVVKVEVPPSPPTSSHSSPSSSEVESPVSIAKCQDEEKQKGKKRKSLVIYSDDDDDQDEKVSQENKSALPSVKVSKPKIDKLLPPIPPKSFNKSPSPSSSNSPSSTKWRCVLCDGRCESLEEYKDHRRILRRILPQLKDHGQHISKSLSKKAHSHHKRVPFLPPQSNPKRPMDADNDDDFGEGLISKCSPTSVTCGFCGDPFQDMAVLNLHIKQKHDGWFPGKKLE